MKRLAGIIRRKMTDPSHRRWKYISPRRRLFGFIALAVLLILVYTGWLLTNDDRIRRQAKLMLEDLVGVDVDVEHASFHFFEGIELKGVKMRFRDQPRHFFTADTIFLKHQPWVLFTQGRVVAQEIRCSNFQIINEIKVIVDAKGKVKEISTFDRLRREVKERQEDAPETEELPLPGIIFSHGRQKTFQIHGDLRTVTYDEPISGHLTPLRTNVYDIAVEETRQSAAHPEHIRLEWDLKTGQVTPIYGTISNPLIRVLPTEYRQWLERYQLDGDFDTNSISADEKTYSLQLKDVKLTFPKEQGGLHLTSIKGELLSTPEGVTARGLTGRIPSLGNANFQLDGRYVGFGADDPFDLNLKIENMLIPQAMSGPLEKLVRIIHDDFNPNGRIDLNLTLSRVTKGEELGGGGKVEFKGLKATPRVFPLPLEDVRGTLNFDVERINNFDVTCRRGQGKINVKGTYDAQNTLKLYIDGKSVAFEPALKNALPKKYQRFWEQMSPTGYANIAMDMIIPKIGPDQATLKLDLDGRAGATYVGFPYPLTKIYGKVEFDQDVLRIKNVQARNGQAVCWINCTSTDFDLPAGPTVKLNIRAHRVAVDKSLLDALPEKSHAFLKKLQPAGELSDISIEFNRQPESDTATQPGIPVTYKTTYHAAMTLKNGSFCYEDYPMKVMGLNGPIDITQKLVQVGVDTEKQWNPLRGKLGDSSISLAGRVQLEKGEVQGYKLLAATKEVTLNKAFADAQPPAVQDVWRQLNPQGKADIELRLSRANSQAEPTWQVLIQPREMSILAKAFPYRLKGITGRLYVSPESVTLDDVRIDHNAPGEKNKLKAVLSGQISQTKTTRITNLKKVVATNFPLDEEMLKALPEVLLPLTSRFKPGGTADVNFSEFYLKIPLQNSTSQPASPKSDVLRANWLIKGGVRLKEAKLDMGFEPRVVTAKLSGYAQDRGKGVAFKLNTELQRLNVMKHPVTAIKGTMIKAATAKVVRIDPLQGRIYDGKLAGEATVHLSEPPKLELSVSLQNVDLNKLFNAGVDDPKKRTDAKGRLSGELALTMTGGKTPSRQAVGELVLSQGKLYKLPVILGLLNMIYLTLPSDSAFQQGTLAYHLKNDRLTFREIFLTGTTLSVLGSGYLDMKTDKLNLTFLTAPPGKLTPMAELAEDILKTISNTLVEIRVTGSVAKPKMETVPLSPLDTIIRRLISPSLMKD